MVLSMMSVAEVVLDKLTVVSRRYWAEVQTIQVKFYHCNQKRYQLHDVYWVKVKALATLILMCDHSPQHTNSDKKKCSVRLL